MQIPECWQATWNSIYFCILTVPLGIILALLVAVFLNSKIKGKIVFRAIYFLPMVVAPAAVGMVWKWMFNANYGIINQIFHTNISWLTDPNLAIISCAAVAIWSAVGYDAVLLLSGLQSVPKNLYEAASLDGASGVQQFFHVTLPAVSPTLFVVVIMRLMSSLKVFDILYMMISDSNPALLDTQSLMMLFYRESFTIGNKGYASAIVVWTVLLIGIVTAFQFWGQKKWVSYDV
ncbi:MAG: carbohydrate ABC transporter permease [Eubacteriaceae bacterium]|jgi:multiple sugar transport system permease protein